MGLLNSKHDNGKVVKKFSDGGYLKTYKNGTTERIRFTKTREDRDFDSPFGKVSIWSKKK